MSMKIRMTLGIFIISVLIAGMGAIGIMQLSGTPRVLIASLAACTVSGRK